ncbi:phage tail tape measure protein [Marilutibacter maris]|uniref:Putative phage tail length tape measure protein n=1 Tax=Marilutibacter maris TaxID=1605891 RepID=A0A2U9TCD2_9GAMM|nr:phage tail tape measure protein [Lysobacter maris]AWV07219.1 putative phage tail length tape measure protein [Lysobacter maris]
MTTESIGTARLDIVVDTEKMIAGVKQATRTVTDFSQAAQEQYNKLNAVEKRRIDSLVKQANTLGLTRAEQIAYNAQLKASGPLLGEINKTLALNAARAQVATTQFNKYGQSQRQVAAALRGVPAQITDIFTSLQGGMNPITVFLQQGGQLKDMFGGIRPAAEALAGSLIRLINPVTAGAAAVGLLAAAWYRVSEAQRQADLALIATGNFAGVTAEQIASLARELDELEGVSRGRATQALTAVAASGRFAGEQFELVAEAAARMEAAAGQSVDATITKFTEISKAPVDALLKLNETEHFLTAAQLERVRALEKEEKQQEAAAEAVRIYADHLDDVAERSRQSLSSVSVWWQQVKDDTSLAFDELGRYIDNLDQLISRYSGLNRGAAAEGASLFTPIAGQAKAIGGILGVANDFAERRFGLGVGFGSPAGPPGGVVDSRAEAAAEETADKAREAQRKFFEEGLRYGSEREQLEQRILAMKADGLQAGIDEDKLRTREAQMRAEFAEREAKAASRKARKRGEADPADAIVRRLEKQIALNEEQLQQDTALTASDRLRIQVQQELDRIGGKITGQRRAEIDAMIDQVSMTGKLVEAHKAEVKAKEQVRRLEAQLTAAEEDRRRANELDIASFRLGDAEMERLQRRLAIEQEYADELQRLRDEGVAESDESWRLQEAAARAARDKMLQDERRHQEALAMVRRDASAGIEKAWADQLEQASNVSGQTYDIFTNTFHGLEDLITEFAQTGKLSFKSFFDDIAVMITQFASKQIVAQFLRGLNGEGQAGAAAGDFFGSFLGAIGAGWGGIANGAAFGNGQRIEAYANGGVVHSPQLFQHGGRMGLMGEAGPEAIMPLRRLPSGRLGVEVANPMPQAGPQTFNITVPVEGQVTYRTRTQIARDTSRKLREASRLGS